MITVLFTDGGLTPIGQPLTRFTKLEVVQRFNEPDSISLTLPALSPWLGLAQPGNRVVVIRDGGILSAGPIEFPGALTWDADDDEYADPGQVVVSSTDDSVWLGCRVTYPDPAHAANAQTAAFYTNTANAEVAMRDLVTKNAASGAPLTVRRVPNLVLGSLASVGSSVSVRTRFEPLSDALRSAALAGGGLGYRVVQDSGQLKFEVYQPTDRSGSVRFSRGLRNLRAIRYQAAGPTTTVAIVGGDGTGSTRTVVERINSSAVAVWGRIETFVNDSSSSTTDLNQSGDEALATGGERAQLSVRAIDTPLQRFGVDYQLGDKVTVEIYPGLELSDVVRAVTITATPNGGEVVEPQIGTDSTSSEPAYVRKLRELDRRLGFVEAT